MDSGVKIFKSFRYFSQFYSLERTDNLFSFTAGRGIYGGWEKCSVNLFGNSYYFSNYITFGTTTKGFLHPL